MEAQIARLFDDDEEIGKRIASIEASSNASTSYADLERRLSAVESFMSLSLTPSEIDPRAGECHGDGMLSPRRHDWRVVLDGQEPVGRRCERCTERQLGTMMWDEARRDELDR